VTVKLANAATAVGAVLALGVVGAGIGYAVGAPSQNRPAAVSFSGAPISTSPRLPIDPVTPYQQDSDFRTLEPGLQYHRETTSGASGTWVYRAPAGWTSFPALMTDPPGTVRWRPTAQTSGTYMLRVAPIVTNFSLDATMQQQTEGMPAGTDVIDSDGPTIRYDFRSPKGFHLFNFFTWVVDPVSDHPILSISVIGRQADYDSGGLDDLLATVRSTARLMSTQTPFGSASGGGPGAETSTSGEPSDTTSSSDAPSNSESPSTP
jgi:hypothetical protein